jgi:DNA-binding response OmpR family regulator
LENGHSTNDKENKETRLNVTDEAANSVVDDRETCNVLVVDDDLDLLECYKILFEYEGYCIETAATPFDAIAKAWERRFMLAILDFTLPDMKGDVLAMKLLETNSSMKLIFISGSNEAKNNIMSMGLNTKFYMKPIDPESLLAATRSFFSEAHVYDVIEPTMTHVAR